MTTKDMPISFGNQNAVIRIERARTDAYSLGDKVSMQVTFDDALVRSYADQYGDRNPIHLDEEAGRKSLFRGRVAHGMLSMNFYSTLLGVGFPGPGSIFVGIEGWKYLAPTRIGDTLTMEAKISAQRTKSSGASELMMDAVATNGQGKSVLTGRLLLIAPRI